MTCVAYKTWQESKCKSDYLTYKFYVKKKPEIFAQYNEKPIFF